MNIFSANNLFPFSYNVSSLFKQEIIPALTEKQKKLVIVALAAIACLAACYTLFRWSKSETIDIDPDGPVIEGNVKNGIGKKSYPDGRVLKGSFKDGALNGDGKKTFVNGQIATGTFLDGELKKGKLTVQSPYGWELEEGEFTDYLLHGQGKRTDVNKQVSEGTFVIGEFKKGKKTLLNNGLAEGEFENGELHGQGKLTWLKTKPHIVTEEGQFYKGKFVKGKKVDHLGNVWEGDFATPLPGGGYMWNGGKPVRGTSFTVVEEDKEQGTK